MLSHKKRLIILHYIFHNYYITKIGDKRLKTINDKINEIELETVELEIKDINFIRYNVDDLLFTWNGEILTIVDDIDLLIELIRNHNDLYKYPLIDNTDVWQDVEDLLDNKNAPLFMCW